MAPVLTLHAGEAQAAFEEHPIEVARRALMTAAAGEGDEWRQLLLRAANSLPHRARIVRTGDQERVRSIDGREALTRIHAAICEALTELPADDPVCRHLAALAPQLALALGGDV